MLGRVREGRNMQRVRGISIRCGGIRVVVVRGGGGEAVQRRRRERTSSDAKQDRVRTDSFLAVEITASSAGGTAKSRDRERKEISRGQVYEGKRGRR